jgi:hypothetical protein
MSSPTAFLGAPGGVLRLFVPVAVARVSSENADDDGEEEVGDGEVGDGEGGPPTLVVDPNSDVLLKRTTPPCLGREPEPVGIREVATINFGVPRSTPGIADDESVRCI